MSDSVTVEFTTKSRREIPQIGQRRTLRVNGKPEIFYTNAVEVKREYVSAYDGYGFTGQATYGPYYI